MAHHTTVQTETKTHHVTLERTEDNGFVAACNESPGFFALGSTEQEALGNIKSTLSDGVSADR